MSTRLEVPPAAHHEWLAKRFIDEKFADASFAIIENGELGGEFRVHEMVLASASEIFERMFYGDFPREDHVKIEDTIVRAFEAFLAFIYTGAVYVDFDRAFPLLYLAKKYLVGSLTSLILGYLESSANESNVAQFVLQGQDYLDDVPEACWSCIEKNARLLLESDEFLLLKKSTVVDLLRRNLRTEEMTIYKRVVAWGEAECERNDLPLTTVNIRSALDGVLRHVRFPLMSGKEFTLGPAKSGLLTQEEQMDIFPWFTADVTPTLFSTAERWQAYVCDRLTLPSNPAIWDHDGETDTFVFKVDRSITIIGVGLYGAYGDSPVEYTVSVELLANGSVLAKELVTVTSRPSEPIMVVNFAKPVKLSADRRCVVAAKLTGPPTRRGLDGGDRRVVQTTKGDANVVNDEEQQQFEVMQRSPESNDTNDVNDSDFIASEPSEDSNSKGKEAAKKRKRSHRQAYRPRQRESKFFKCMECHFSTRYAQVLKRHMRHHTGQKPYKYELCEKAFSLQVSLTRHRLSHFDENSTMDPLLDAILSKSEVKDELDDDASRGTDGLTSALDAGERSEDSRSDSSQEERWTDEDSLSDVDSEREESNVKRKRTATAEKGRTTNDKTTFSCTECDYTSAYAQVLQRHMRRHTGQKPYKCDLCEKCFTLKVSLDAHRRTHFAEKPFKCTQCDYACNQKPNLISHERTHLGKQFECPQCAAKFSRAQTLRQHMQLHTEQTVTCEVCGHNSNTQAIADAHKRRGRCNKESTFKCHRCDFRTTSASYLRMHMERRFDPKTGRCLPRQIAYVAYYTCPTCRHTTSSKTAYEAHLRRRKGNTCPNRGRKRMNPAFPVTFDRAQRRLNQGLDKRQEGPGPSSLKKAGRKRVIISDSDDSD